MQRRQFIKGAVGISTTSILPFQATEVLAAKKNKKKKKGELADNLMLLNEWGEQPANVQQVYSAVYKALAASPEATYADAAADPEVQRLCAENGVTHLGGPMLGTVSSRGARVWVRTLKPARVEVQATVAGNTKTFGPVASTAATDLSAVVQVTGLEPSTTYPYRVLIDGKPIDIPEHAAITTA
ncbi:MAG: DUF7800 domain-containing protein, partial [Planctomycetota bacterium]